MNGHQIQAVLHELLAARLTDAPEADVEKIRTLFNWTLAADEAGLESVAEPLFDYYDGQIADLTGRLEGSDSDLLRQIREEALSARMIAILQAIERHAAVLASQRGQRSPVDFLGGYRRHVREQHGRLEPPDFERRRRIPISQLYVSPVIIPITGGESSGRSADENLPVVDFLTFADNIDRTVLLGNPGGGKTTAANVLMNYYASDSRRRVPFLVTLREFASTIPPERSVAGYIEHRLEVFYQCPAPPGVIDHLLLSGTAVVIFDGLDELLDSSHRAEVSAIVERFCAEYPLVPTLATSRLVGYDEARLDDQQFSCYRLDGFTDDQVREYVEKWFAQEIGVTARESVRWAETFMQESRSVPDLRSNPLMLALMCILYRGAGSLPRRRVEVYERCTSLLFRTWDDRRQIHQEIRAAHLLEPALRYLAWWLFTRDQMQPSVTEQELINETAAFMHGRGFESEVSAREAGAEFVGFCRGRLWVFSDIGSTATGEPLYSFTHRTFLEYFCAAYLAYGYDTPERLSGVLATHIAKQEWTVVTELALQIKDRTSDQGADRFYISLLSDRRYRSLKSRSSILQYLARSLRSVDPSPGTARELVEAVLAHLFSGAMSDSLRYLPLSWLIASSGPSCRDVVNDAIERRIAAMAAADDSTTRIDALRVAAWLPYATWGVEFQEREAIYPQDFWYVRTKERMQSYSSAVIAAADSSTEMRYAALLWGLIGAERALQMPNAASPLVQVQPTGIFEINWASYLVSAAVVLAQGVAQTSSADPSEELGKFSAFGRYLISNPKVPWIPGPAQEWSDYHSWNDPETERVPFPSLDPVTYLGAAAILLIASEGIKIKSLPDGGPDRFGPFKDVVYYMLRRWGKWDGEMPSLPVPPPFNDVFLSWANGEIDFTQPASDLISQPDKL